MIFGDVDIKDAEGAVLAHSMRLPSGVISKGTMLSRDHIATLLQAHVARITVARLEQGDMNEDAAALALGKAFCAVGANINMSAAHTGRINLYAACNGVMGIDVDVIHAFNAINPMITIATVPAFQRLSKGDMIATIKIIAYGVPQTDVERAMVFAQTGLRLHSAKLHRALLIETSVSGQRRSSKGADALEHRLSRLDGELLSTIHCDHSSQALADALKLHAADAQVIFILTGSATSDVADTGPAGLLGAGGRMIHFGMPVDPGNLLFLGALGEIPVVGLPGCARSPALNGADWVLERLICGLPVEACDIQSMGVGGLLKEISQRGLPREGKS